MKKNTFAFCFFMLILCILHISIPNVVFGQSPALQVFNNHKELLLREDIRLLLPEVLNTFNDEVIRTALRPINLDIYLGNPSLLRSLNRDIAPEFIGLLSSDLALREFFGSEQFYDVLKTPNAIDELLKLIRDAPTTPKTLEMVSEDNHQQGNPNTTLEPFKLVVKDLYGEPVAGVSVTFRITLGDGHLLYTTSFTNEEGEAETTLTLGVDFGTTLVEASVEGISEKLTFIATTIPITSPPQTLDQTLEIVGENSRSGNPNTSLTDPFVVIVKDQNGKPVAGVSVTFSITHGEGALLNETEMTNQNGHAGTILTLGTAPVTLVEASVKGSSEKRTFIAISTPITSPPDTDIPIPPELIISITPSKIVSPIDENDENIVLLVRITGGERIVGYEITVEYDGEVLNYFKPDEAPPKFNCNYLPYAVQVTERIEDENNPAKVTLVAVSPHIDNSGDGILAKLIFVVKNKKASTLTLTKVNLIDSNGNLLSPILKNAQIVLYDVDVNSDNNTDEKDLNVVAKNFGISGGKGDVNEDGVVDIRDLILVAQLLDSASALYGTAIKDLCPEDVLPEDVNGDGIVNILDMVLVAGSFGESSAAPSVRALAQGRVSAADVQTWLTQVKAFNPNIPETTKAHLAYQRGIAVLENLSSTLTQTTAAPQRTALLLNYPNPFNPETWIPYQLAEATAVTVTIRSMKGTLIRTLSLGHQPAGLYRSKSRAAYWDGRNEFGEHVASGVYFYTLTAGDFTATRKMLIRK